MLLSHGGPPTIAGAGAGVDDVGLPASPFEVLIPAVKPGTYRITRQFVRSIPGTTTGQMTLSTKVAVKPCPKGERPAYTDPSTFTGPSCMPR